jgi:hypothetical protein
MTFLAHTKESFRSGPPWGLVLATFMAQLGATLGFLSLPVNLCAARFATNSQALQPPCDRMVLASKCRCRGSFLVGAVDNPHRLASKILFAYAFPELNASREPMAIFVLVHGSTHSARAWDLVKAELERQHHAVITPELPADESNASATRYADVVTASISESEHPIVVGHSAAVGFCRSSQAAVACVAWYFWPQSCHALE